MFSAQVISDSISPDENRLITMEWTFPRFILPQISKHRMFSISAGSSRAIGTKRQIAQVREAPYVPSSWGRNQAGMVAAGELSESEARSCREYWLRGVDAACDLSQKLYDMGVHKEIASRPLEPYMWQKIVISATSDWFDHMFALRLEYDAQPDFQTIARLASEAIAGSTPKHVDYGGWVFPYLSDDECDGLDWLDMVKVSAGRIARVSYGSQKEFSFDEDMSLGARLLEYDPPHAVPFEPIARAARPVEFIIGKDVIFGNFTGWHQARHTLWAAE
jgi:hypothetical protein